MELEVSLLTVTFVIAGMKRYQNRRFRANYRYVISKALNPYPPPWGGGRGRRFTFLRTLDHKIYIPKVLCFPLCLHPFPRFG